MLNDEYDNDPGFWKAVFNFGRAIFAKGEATQEAWNKNYQDYIHSQPWKEKSKFAMDRAGNRCQLCNSKDKLHTHHRTYERLGDENQNDLIVLCGKCHAKFHNKGQ